MNIKEFLGYEDYSGQNLKLSGVDLRNEAVHCPRQALLPKDKVTYHLRSVLNFPLRALWLPEILSVNSMTQIDSGLRRPCDLFQRLSRQLQSGSINDLLIHLLSSLHIAIPVVDPHLSMIDLGNLSLSFLVIIAVKTKISALCSRRQEENS